MAEHPEQPFAAIAPQAAAVEYGLEVIAQDIQEISENFTRFLDFWGIRLRLLPWNK